ncbi:MAG: PepSY domain-containing protein [Rhodobacteraceae bacterium]|nr:PepSY domain-containing protein [Paracoccaceae bacterium]
MTDSKLTRRQALARLGITPLALYVAPAVLTLSTAASASSATPPSDPSEPSVATPPTPPSPASSPSAPGDVVEADEASSDRCYQDAGASGNSQLSISQDDFERAQAAVDAGYAKPLSQIWQGILADYPGRIVSISFSGFRYRPRYRLKAVSSSGRLETVIVSARTGRIERIVGC